MSEFKDNTLNAFYLRQASDIISSRIKIDQIDTSQIYYLRIALNLYFELQDQVNKQPNNPDIKDVQSFLLQKNVHDLSNDLLKIADFLEKQNTQNTETSKEQTDADNSNIPPGLEIKVALHKKFLADQATSQREHPVADTIKKLRKTWLEKEKQRLIYENASKERQSQIDEETERFFKKTVDSKRNYQDSTLNIKKAAEYILAAEGINQTVEGYQEALDRIVYGAETGAIDLENSKDVYSATQLIKRDFLNQETIIDNIDNIVQSQLRSNEIDPFQNNDEKVDTELTYAEQDINTKYTQSLKSYSSNLSKTDFDTVQKQAKNDSEKIISRLTESIPNAKLSDNLNYSIETHKDELEKAIYADTLEINKRYQQLGSSQRIQLRPNVETIGGHAIGIVNKTGNTLNVSEEALKLYSQGITPQKLNQIVSTPGSRTAEVLSKNKLLQKQIEFQLKQIHDSKLGKEIANNLNKLKPLSDSYYRLSSTAQKALDPVGTAKSYLYKRAGQSIGEYLAKRGGSAFAQKAGDYIVKDGLKSGIKNLVSDGTKKLLIKGVEWAAVKLGVSLTAESLNAFAPGLGFVVDVVIQIGLWIIEKTYIAIRDKFRDLIGYDEENAEENKKALLVGLTAAGLTISSFFSLSRTSIRTAIFATRVALISVIGVIWLSIITITAFLALTFMVAPLLSTFVQFDAQEKVKYEGNEIQTGPTSCSNMPWPFSKTYSITQGPRNTSCTHNGSIAESADFGTPLGTPILSMTSGTVVEAIKSNEGYGNHVRINTTTDDGKSFVIVYAHFSTLSVSKGAKVSKGTVLGRSGNTGYSTGPHLHVGYIGIDYNSCPAGNHKIKENCCSISTCNQP